MPWLDLESQVAEEFGEFEEESVYQVQLRFLEVRELVRETRRDYDRAYRARQPKEWHEAQKAGRKRRHEKNKEYRRLYGQVYRAKQPGRWHEAENERKELARPAYDPVKSAAYAKAKREADLEKARAYGRAQYQKHKARQAERAKERREERALAREAQKEGKP